MILPHEMASSGRAPESEPSNSCPVLTKSAPYGWTRGAPVPIAPYTALITLAKQVQRHGLVAFTAADFDFRELGENWFKATRR